MAVDRRWWSLSIAGIVAGGAGIAAFSLSVLVLIALALPVAARAACAEPSHSV